MFTSRTDYYENNVVSIRFAQKDVVFFINSLPTAENFGQSYNFRERFTNTAIRTNFSRK